MTNIELDTISTHISTGVEWGVADVELQPDYFGLESGKVVPPCIYAWLPSDPKEWMPSQRKLLAHSYMEKLNDPTVLLLITPILVSPERIRLAVGSHSELHVAEGYTAMFQHHGDSFLVYKNLADAANSFSIALQTAFEQHGGRGSLYMDLFYTKEV